MEDVAVNHIRIFPIVAAATCVVAVALPADLRGEDDAMEGKVALPDQIAWAPGPAALPPGAEAAVLYGNPGEDGLFALRLKLPAGYHIPPHTHPKPEIVTVITGTFRLGMGETADHDGARVLPAGGFLALSPGVAHFAYADDGTVIQLNSTGPWTLTYVNPDDDPRNK
ncbi:cupin domain-containing protein [Mesorhizobium sp. L-8-10]|uniref:cupin domain-containing protein n=1 Tax=Mesorhizobium sp. L-8-10 TaxID=2744523 RepID=UPI0019285087|nr:cupin domain-containing protein [Mesorhizobium sp. L-8-10]